MERSIPQGPASGPVGDQGNGPRDGAGPTFWVGVGIVLVMLVVYVASNPDRTNFYNHFVWQASAWLEGQAGIRYPVEPSPGLFGNAYFQDVMVVSAPTASAPGRALIPFPPLPAVVLLPFVAIWGLTTDAQLLAAILGALAVGAAYWMLGRLRIREPVRIAATVFLGLGTVFWYTSSLGTTWFLAHVLAVLLTCLAIGVALSADPAFSRAAVREGDRGGRRADHSGWNAGRLDWLLGQVDGRQFLAGLFLGLAATARLTVALGAPFLVFAGGGGGWLRRGVSAGLGMAIPLLGLVAYNLATTGHVFHPAYEALYRYEVWAYPDLGYNGDWGIEDLRYLPQNLGIMLLGAPDVLPACPAGAAPGVFSQTCPLVIPRAIGMSLILTSPAYLLGIPAPTHVRRDRIVAGALLAVVAIALLNLMHFSQGWVQFGYRFSNDFAPFALILVAIGLERRGGLRAGAVILIGVSIAIQLWGVIWGAVLGW